MPLASHILASVALLLIISEGSGSGDRHIYREDGWIVRDYPAGRSQQEPDVSVEGFAVAGNHLEEMGRLDLASRARAASARLSAERSGGSAAFWETDQQWVVTFSDTKHSSTVPDFTSTSTTISEAVAKYASYHASALARRDPDRFFAVYRYWSTSRAPRVRPVLKRCDTESFHDRPSFHGEGWGNRVMALSAVFAMSLVTGRLFMVDWKSSYALRDVVEPLFDWNLSGLLAREPHWATAPRATISSPDQLQGAGFNLPVKVCLPVFTLREGIGGARRALLHLVRRRVFSTALCAAHLSDSGGVCMGNCSCARAIVWAFIQMSLSVSPGDVGRLWNTAAMLASGGLCSVIGASNH